MQAKTKKICVAKKVRIFRQPKRDLNFDL